MADQFIGLQMLVTLRNPPSRLQGTVSAVSAGFGLTLSNVWRLDSKCWEPRMTIPSDNIVDLVEVPYGPPPNNAFTASNNPGASVAATAATVAATAKVTATATVTTAATGPPHTPSPASRQQPMVPRPVPPHSAPTFTDSTIHEAGEWPGFQPELKKVQQQQSDKIHSAGFPGSRDPTPTMIYKSTTEDLKIESRPTDNPLAVSGDEDLPTTMPAVTFQGKLETQAETQSPEQKKKRRPRAKYGSYGSARGGVQDDPSASPQAVRSKQAGQGKGWRQTPILQTAYFQPFNSLKGTGGRKANDNGWASEDVTDVQEMGDFDFAGSLAKFDKHNLFEQMRKDDAVDEADRLVSHNRQARPKPGTAGGKNLHYRENVLDMPPATTKPTTAKEKSNDFWNSEADDKVIHNVERPNSRELGGRQDSRRGENKMAPTRRSRSRKASAPVTAGQGPSRINSGVSHPNLAARTANRSSSRPMAKMVDKKRQPPAPAAPQGLYVLPSNRRLEPVSPLQMLNLENIAHNEIGLTEDMMTENAGRGIAEVALTALTDPAIKVRHTGTADPSSGIIPAPTVVVLAGNNKSGMRAIAAARHLRNKGINALVCVVGLEHGERELLEDVRQQVRIYKNFGGRLFAKTDLFEHIRKISIPTLTIDTPRASLASLTNPAPVTLIIDALLGLAVSFEELRMGDQATTYELIEWANRNEAFVLAVDIPTGIDPSSGKVSVVDGSRLYVKPRFVVAMGCPKRGLLEVMAGAAKHDLALGVSGNGDGAGTTLSAGDGMLADDGVTEWKLFIADMGLGASVWKKAGTKIRRGIDFDDKWVLPMRFQAPAEEDEDE